GPAGSTAHLLKSLALHPFGLSGNAIDDYRDKRQDEAQFATFLNDKSVLGGLRDAFSDDADMFYKLEALDVSDLIRHLNVWVTRQNDASGDIEYADLSDGERQLLMVMGLLRIARGKRVLFLLDEPDTHLNPHWQHNYLKLIERWTGTAADSDNCHIVLTSHNPLTISALSRAEVRVLSREADGSTAAQSPYVDPRGMGFTTTLTEIFGLPTSLDARTQRLVDLRSRLARRTSTSDTHQRRLLRINDVLARLGFLQEDRDPLYQTFLRALHDVRWANRPPLTASALAAQHAAMKALINELIAKQGGHA
ncbi:MAG TPA: AAA family ATPase, partial [Aquabacterium sp.]|uniref:AAA family ATPase n=1 Tax=Aquabacterium sp. TaxID=1872578 RepID=UPI002E350F5F